MRKKIFAALVVAVGVAFAGYNMIQSQNDKNALSMLALSNVEALAEGEVMDGNCEGSWSKECCVCGNKHYTYASPVNDRCESRDGCSHYN